MHANRGPAKCPPTEEMNGRGVKVKDLLGENRETKEKKNDKWPAFVLVAHVLMFEA